MILKLLFFHLINLILSVTSLAVLDCTPQLNGDCKVVSMETVTQANEAIVFNGQTSTYTDTTSTTLGFYDNYTLQYVPTGVLTIFPNLQSFEIVNCGTTTLVTDAYNNCNNLLNIILEGGNIPNVPAGIASTCTSVFGISLANNAIASIDVDAFRGLTNLDTLKLDQNQLTCIPSMLFQKSPALAQLTVTFNKISAIDSTVISNMPNLAVVDFSGNLITYLPLLDLTGTTSSIIIYGFADNPITAINSGFTSIFSGRPAISDMFIFDSIPCLSSGTTSFGITSADYLASSATLSTCFSNYNSATMSETAPCPLITTTTVASTASATVTTTVASVTTTSSVTSTDLICVTYPEWRVILKNFHLPQWKGRCPRFRRKKVCLHKCFFVPGGDGDNDRDDRFTPHTHIPGQTYKPDHSSTFRPIFPNRPHIFKPGTNRPGFFRPGKKPNRG